MMKHIGGWLVGAVLLGALAVTPATARVVTIQTAASLPDRSDRSVDQALDIAVGDCVRRATAMGLSWIRLQDAAIVTDHLVVQMVATDEEIEGEEEVRVIDLTSRTALGRGL